MSQALGVAIDNANTAVAVLHIVTQFVPDWGTLVGAPAPTPTAAAPSQAPGPAAAAPAPGPAAVATAPQAGQSPASALNPRFIGT